MFGFFDLKRPFIYRFGSKMHVPNGGERGLKKVIVILVLPRDLPDPTAATPEVKTEVIC